MKINYTINAADFLEYYLYMVSKSAVISRKRNIVKYSFFIIYMLFGLYFIAYDRIIFGVFFLALGIGWSIFYPKLNRKSLERFYAKYTQENFGNQMNRQTEILITSDIIFVNDGEIENRIPVSEIEKMIEIRSSFFLREKTGNTFIIPKNQINETDFRSEIATKNIPVQNEINWQWK